MRVLMVAGNFAPDPLIGAVRPTSLARYLSEHGHQVRVLALNGPFPASELPTDPPVTRPHAPVLRPRFPMMQRRSRDSQEPEGRGGTGVLLQQHRPLAGDLPSRALRGASRVWRSLVEIPDEYACWVPAAVRAGRTMLSRWNCDVIFASGPTFCAFVVARFLSRDFGIPWMADYRDPWGESPYSDHFRFRQVLDDIMERRIVQSASAVSIVSEPLGSRLSRRLGRPVEVVVSGYDPAPDASVAEQRIPLSDARLNLLYVGGNLYGGKRSPLPLFESARRLGYGPEDLQFHFLGSRDDEIRPLASEIGVLDLVRVHPSVSRAEARQWQRRADALMLLLWNDPREVGTYTGKIFEYISSGRPILLTGYGEGVAAKLIRERELGFVASNSTQSDEALRNLLSAKLSPAVHPDLPVSRRAGLSREHQNDRLMQALIRIASPQEPLPSSSSQDSHSGSIGGVRP